jgi:hypothetical protein
MSIYIYILLLLIFITLSDYIISFMKDVGGGELSKFDTLIILR